MREKKRTINIWPTYMSNESGQKKQDIWVWMYLSCLDPKLNLNCLRVRFIELWVGWKYVRTRYPTFVDTLPYIFFFCTLTHFLIKFLLCFKNFHSGGPIKFRLLFAVLVFVLFFPHKVSQYPVFWSFKPM